MLNIDTFRKDLITCPHCGYENPDSWEFAHRDQGTDLECPSCEKPFFLEVEREVYYTTNFIKE